MKTILATFLALGFALSASAASFKFDILSHVTFNHAWSYYQVDVFSQDDSGSGVYESSALATGGYSGNYWAQGAHAHGWTVDGTAAAAATITTTFFFDLGLTPTDLLFTHTRTPYRNVADGNADGFAEGVAYDSIVGGGTGLINWQSVTVTTHASGSAYDTADTIAVPDSSVATIALLGVSLGGLAILRRKID